MQREKERGWMRRKGELQTQTRKLGRLAGRQEPAPCAVLIALQKLRIKSRMINSARASLPALARCRHDSSGDERSVSRGWDPSFRFSLGFKFNSTYLLGDSEQVI